MSLAPRSTLISKLTMSQSTSGMAADVVALLDYVGWKERDLHVIGISLGGMIAQGTLSNRMQQAVFIWDASRVGHLNT